MDPEAQMDLIAAHTQPACLLDSLGARTWQLRGLDSGACCAIGGVAATTYATRGQIWM